MKIITLVLIALWSLQSHAEQWHGAAAIAAVEKIEGELSVGQRLVVLYEGYASTPYIDAGNIAIRVGQRGRYFNARFKIAYAAHMRRARHRFGAWEYFTPKLKNHLILAEYRGDLGISPKTVQLINLGMCDTAATEFLNNQEYREHKKRNTGGNIVQRFEAISNAIKNH